ncbi:hypothetical protein CUS24_13525 [Enterococcus faecium]|uniref:hypothetical protein n=1 Tax=Enterococcus faecium TaxID=1352 RepID=UPI000CF284CA|nr:hypothetical protein [Enterococcus faecium]PQG23802.1 hypothetical protein CUS24_13525 [Enterococcus faecium]
MKNYKKISLIFALCLAVFFSAIRMDDYLFDGNLNQELSTLKRQHKIDDFEKKIYSKLYEKELLHATFIFFRR